MQKFKYIIVGTGQATGTLLSKLISSGDAIAVIEGNKVGGSCVNYGCTPTKTLVASAKAIHQARRGSLFGFSASPEVHFSRVMERMNEIRNSSSDGLKGWIESSENVRLISEYASFTGPKTLKVGKEEISGEHIFINVGTRSSTPPIEGIDKINWLDSAGLLELRELPEHLLIIGGGYIGVEFAQVFRRLGSRVTLIQRGSQLMPNEDRDVAESIQQVLEKENIDIYLSASAISVTQEKQVRLTIEHEGHKKTLEGSELLIAAGRTANSDTLELGKAGINTYGKGFIEVDDFCRTNIEGVFALGDVNGHGAFTHTSVNDAEIVLDHLFGGSRKISSRIPIYALFTDPPLGRVGLSEKAAIEKGHQVLKATKPMSQISRAKEMGETDGFAKLIVDGDTDMVLGAAIHGPGGDEIINMFAAIMHSQIPCKKYREVVLVHPTVSELMPWVLDGLEPVK